MALEKKLEKLAELIKYISYKSSNDPHFTKVKMFKILFFSDFHAYNVLGCSISGDNYVKKSRGPVPMHGNEVLEALIKNNEMGMAMCSCFDDSFGQRKPVALSSPDLSLFSAKEIAIVDRMIQEVDGDTEQVVSEKSHQFIGWQVTEMDEIIPYETCLVVESDEEFTKEEILYAIGLKDEAEAALRLCHG